MYSVFRAILIYHGKLEKRADLSQLWNFKHCKEIWLLTGTVTRLGLKGLMHHSWHKLHFYKKTTLQNVFLISVMLKWHRASVACKKSEFLKLYISFFHYSGCQNWDQWQKLVEKVPIYSFSTFGSQINQFERKKLGKRQKNSKNLKVAGNYPNI